VAHHQITDDALAPSSYHGTIRLLTVLRHPQGVVAPSQFANDTAAAHGSAQDTQEVLKRPTFNPNAKTLMLPVGRHTTYMIGIHQSFLIDIT